jgi:5'-3' exonuclease
MKILLVDGHYYLYRSFYAVRNLSNSRGEPTNAIYAFTKALRKMLADLQPTHGAVLWDAGLPERRVALQPAYKEQRPPMPDDLAAQEDQVMSLCPLLGLHSLSIPSTEADDLIASYTKAAPEDANVIIATSDKDIYQLVNDRTRIYSTAKADLERVGQAAGFTLLGPAEVEEKWGVPAGAIGDVLSLTGDSSDNIPGVPGIGGKTASALIRQFGGLDEMLARLDNVEKATLQEKLRSHVDLIQTNREMVRLDENIPLPAGWDSLRIAPRHDELLSFLRGCEFKSLVAEVEKEAGGLRSLFDESLQTDSVQDKDLEKCAPALSESKLKQGELFG